MTWQGNVVSVHLATEAGAPMASPASIEAIAGKGVQGDRYCKGIGHFSHNKGARRQITLFESEVLETLLRDHNIELAPDECRMNIVTQGVPLTHLMHQRFKVGNAILRGLKLNEPCSRLNEVTGKRVIKVLVHRCGLFAEILQNGVIQAGDLVTSIDAKITLSDGMGDIAQ